MTTLFRIFAAWIFAVFLFASPASAQFPDQATWVGSGSGSANAQVIPVQNAVSYTDIVGVLIKFQPSVTNTSAATLALQGVGGGPFAIKKASGSGLVNLVGGELVSGQPTLVMFDGGQFILMSPLALPVTSAYIQGSALGFGAPSNVNIVATVGSNQLTVALKTIAGTDATSSNPILIPFRDSTIANGDPVWRSVTAAASFTISSGNTMGCLNGVMCRLWIVALDNSGTIQVCAFNAFGGTNVAPINESGLQTSQVGSGGGNSAQVYYCNNPVSIVARPIRIIGYIDIQEVTAGTWATGPTLVQLMGPGIRRPSDVVQRIYAGPISSSTVLGTGATQTAVSSAITPTSAANPILATATVSIDVAGGFSATLQFSRGASPTLVGPVTSIGGGGGGTTLRFGPTVTWVDVPNTSSLLTYYIYGTVNSASQATVNSSGNSMILLQEIMGAIEPANDDAGFPETKVG